MGRFIELDIESKCFTLAICGGGGLRITERSWKTENSVLLGFSSIQWLGKVLEESLSRKKEVYSATRDGYCSFIAQRCENRKGRYVEISEYSQGGRRNMLCIPEGENGWGWRKMREALVEHGKEKTKEGGLHGGAKPSDGRGKLKHYERSYKEVLATSIPRAAKEKVAGAKVLDRGKGRWQREGTVNHAHGRASIECQSWEMQRKLLEMQGQLRALQRDMATIVAFVGSLKEREGADKSKDKGLDVTRKKALPKGKYNRGWNVWRRAKSQDHCGAGASQVKAHEAQSGGSVSRTQLNGSGSGPTELAKPSSSPIQSIELHGLGFVPESIQTTPIEGEGLQTAPMEVVGVAGVVSPESCAQNPLLGIEARVPSALEKQSSWMREAGVSRIPAAGSGRPVENLELAEVEEDSDDFMHSVEDELFSPCGLEDFSMGSEYQNQNNKMGNPTPLNYYFPDQASDWVIHKAKEIQQFVGIECVGYEEQFIALLTAMKAGHHQKKRGNTKKSRELKRLMWSMNSEASSSRNKANGKGLNVLQ